MSNKILFCHIPKTAGMNINCNLQKNVNYEYFCHKILKYNIDNYKNFYKFSVIRDPFDRVISVYFYTKGVIDCLINDKNYQVAEIENYEVAIGNWNKLYNIYKKYNINSIYDYLNNYSKIYYDLIFSKIDKLKFYNENYDMRFYYIVLFLPQYLFICDNNNNILVDEIFNINNLNELEKKLNINLKNKINKSKRINFDINKIDKDIIMNIKNIYKKDYEIFKLNLKN